MGERDTGVTIKGTNPWPFLPLNPHTGRQEKERKEGRERGKGRDRMGGRGFNSWCPFEEVKKGLVCVFAYIIPKANSDTSLRLGRGGGVGNTAICYCGFCFLASKCYSCHQSSQPN